MKKIRYLLFLMLFIGCLWTNVYSSNNSYHYLCETTEEYSKWLLLSDEEKMNTIAPKRCDSIKTKKTINIFSFFNKSKPVLNSVDINSSENLELLDHYDSRSSGYISPVKNQYTTEFCWAFAGANSVETYMLMHYGTLYDFSERHIANTAEKNYYGTDNPTFGREIDQGGNYSFTNQYFIAGLGPISDDDMLLDDSSSYTRSQLESYKKIVNVQEVRSMWTDTNSNLSDTISLMKNELITYGSIDSSFAFYPGYINWQTFSYYYNGSNYSNHEISIVGWDDNYSKTNFNSSHIPTGDGAWIVKNSWGTEDEESGTGDGYLYISYYDTRINTDRNVVSKVNYDVHDNTYFNDLAGLGGGSHLYWDINNLSVAEKYTRETTDFEKVKELKLALSGPGTFEVFINPNNDNLSDENLISVGTGTLTYFGYYSIDVSDKNIYLTGDTFALVVKLQRTGDYIYVPVQDNNYSYANGPVGKSFFNEGSDYQDITLDSGIGDYKISFCFKVSTDNVIREYTNLKVTTNSITSEPKTYYDLMSNMKLDSSVVTSIKDDSSSVIDTTSDIQLKTGYTLVIDSYNLTINIVGDITGDGLIKVNDVVKLNDFVLDKVELSEKELSLVDFTGDSLIKVNDVVKLNDFVLKKIPSVLPLESLKRDQ